MTTTAAAWPRSQHWTIDGFRVTVLLYKSNRARACRACGRRGAIHCAWADRPDGFRGPSADFCDDHRPAKGTMPDLDYERITSDRPSGLGQPARSYFTVTFERLAPNPAWLCGTCGQPSAIRRELRCEHCTDPAHYTVSTVRKLSITADGHDERIVTSIGHDPHTITTTHHCAGHPSQEAR
jgi:hypothetical protein